VATIYISRQSEVEYEAMKNNLSLICLICLTVIGCSSKETKNSLSQSSDSKYYLLSIENSPFDKIIGYSKIQIKPTLIARNESKTDIQNKAPIKPIEELLNAEDYETLHSLPTKWHKTLSCEQKRDLVANLLGHVRSERLLKLKDADKLNIGPRLDPSKGTPENKLFVRYDFLTEGGRCTWAISEILYCTLPVKSFGMTYSQADLDAGFLRTCQRVIRSMTILPIESLAPTECARQASMADADPRLLEELAKNPNTDVRLAVAKNRHTPFEILKQLIKNDLDENVRQAAADNNKHARSIESVFIP
jgi:hypothetical protein